MTNRRRFLQTTAAALAGLAASSRGIAEGGSKEMPFIVGVQSYTFRSFDVEPTLKRIKDLGLGSVEFYQKHAPFTDDQKRIDALLRLCKDYNVTPRAWGVQSFGKHHDANKKIFDFAKKLGVKVLSASPDPDAFDSLDKLVDEYKIAIAIHPHGPIGPMKMDRWYSAEIIHNAVKNHHPLIGSCLDTGHLIRAAQLGKKLDVPEQIRIMGDRNFGIHLKDVDNSKDEDVIIGKAALDVPAVLKALQDVKFKGMISIEYEAKPEDPSPDVKACLAVLQESAKKLA